MILDPDYARIFTQARIIAWQYGYACVAHGSYTRDLDLLLTPWEDRATPNHDQLLKLIAAACGLRFRDGQEDIYKAKPDFTDKPHGRRSCSLFFPASADRRWVDISITPCAPKGSAAGNAEYDSWVPLDVQAAGEASAWWALVMGAAASIEDAANCLRDPDAKKQADGAAKHYREAAQQLMAAHGVDACVACGGHTVPGGACQRKRGSERPTGCIADCASADHFPETGEMIPHGVAPCEPCGGKGIDPACRDETCTVCGGSGVVPDGEIDCYSNGEPFENGPIKCVKDCPKCAAGGEPR